MNIQFECHDENNLLSEEKPIRAFSYVNYSIPAHFHDFYEMNVVLGGIGKHEIEGAVFSVKMGDVFVIPPKSAHAYYDTRELEVYHLLLKKEFINEIEPQAKNICGYLQLMEIEPYLRQSFSKAMFLHLTSQQLSVFLADAKILEEGGEYDGDEFLPLKKCTAQKMIYTLSHLLHKQLKDRNTDKGEKYEGQILDTLGYIHSHFWEKLTVPTLAERVFLSRSTFLRSFNSVCGTSPTEYIRRYRTEKAAELSRLSRLPKTDIAHLCGFYDLSHMERTLKNKIKAR